VNFIKHTVALSAVAVLSGCSTSTLAPITQGVNAVQAESDRANANLRSGTPIERSDDSFIRRSTKVWVPISKVEAKIAPAAAAALGRDLAVNRRFSGLSEMGAYITQLTGVPVNVASAALKSSVETMNSAGAESAASNSGTPGSALPPPAPLPMPMPMPSMPGAISSPATATSQVASIVYTGKVSGFLDLVAARYGVSWEWANNGIHIFKTKSQTFRLAALPGDTSLASKVGTQSNNATGSTQGSQASGSSNSEMRAGVEFAGLSVWKGIEDSIKTMLSPAGKLVVTSATGTITVEDTPMVLDRVGKFIEDQNKALSRQVVINVRVLAVDISKSEQYGINWDMVYQNVNRGLGLSLANSNPLIGGSNLALRVLSGSMFDGSSAMIEALSKQGRVSQVTSASLVTINNQPAPIQVGRQTAYLASSTTTIGTGGAGNTVTLQPGQVTTGFSMNMLPHILDSKRLMLQYSGDISTLTNLATVNSGGSSIQTPEIDTRNFLQRTFLNSGETLVVTGFEQFALNGDTQGVGHAENLALGGRLSATNTRTVLVVLIQPVVAGGL
jgi:type IVB pilus formation R64 PilN family outer membrane protein